MRNVTRNTRKEDPGLTWPRKGRRAAQVHQQQAWAQDAVPPRFIHSGAARQAAPLPRSVLYRLYSTPQWTERWRPGAAQDRGGTDDRRQANRRPKVRSVGKVLCCLDLDLVHTHTLSRSSRGGSHPPLAAVPHAKPPPLPPSSEKVNEGQKGAWGGGPCRAHRKAVANAIVANPGDDTTLGAEQNAMVHILRLIRPAIGVLRGGLYTGK